MEQALEHELDSGDVPSSPEQSKLIRNAFAVLAVAALSAGGLLAAISRSDEEPGRVETQTTETTADDLQSTTTTTMETVDEAPIPIHITTTTEQTIESSVTSLPEGIPNLVPGEMWLDQDGFIWVGQENGTPIKTRQEGT